jgi:hypothetical protein
MRKWHAASWRLEAPLPAFTHVRGHSHCWAGADTTPCRLTPVGTATGYGLDDREVGVRAPMESLLHLVSSPMGTGALCPGREAGLCIFMAHCSVSHATCAAEIVRAVGILVPCSSEAVPKCCQGRQARFSSFGTLVTWVRSQGQHSDQCSTLLPANTHSNPICSGDLLSYQHLKPQEPWRRDVAMFTAGRPSPDV